MADSVEARLADVYRRAQAWLKGCHCCGLKFLDPEEVGRRLANREDSPRPNEGEPIGGKLMNGPIDNPNSTPMLPIVCPRCAFVHLVTVGSVRIPPQPPR